QAQALTLPAHIHGYPQIVFGGYLAGLLAERSGADTVRVDFRRPVMVGTPILLSRPEHGHAICTATDDTLLVEATPTTLALDPPPAPSWAAAKSAVELSLSGDRTVTDCYGCGLACEPGLGLRLFPSELPGHQQMAATWTPDARLADESGELPPEVVWSALDCPGGRAAFVFSHMRGGAFTAALSATLLRPVYAGNDYISHAWIIAREGRKHTVGVALSTADGDLCAVSEALWIEPRQD
ncbi:PaaI family thioesterase, partial [Streptomyces sp. NPDC101166]|uniref:PaaI family thioesterase n=1 Tax=Streptomyces sp. NPDC101166 TaxID=3366120 RepID=UPI00381F1D7E